MSTLATNMFIKNYLVGKSLSYVSSDFRYYYFTEGSALTAALVTMPSWYKIFYANEWL